ncbi:hypothetical protein RB213_000184 [Colletotrichum asianum]
MDGRLPANKRLPFHGQSASRIHRLALMRLLVPKPVRCRAFLWHNPWRRCQWKGESRLGKCGKSDNDDANVGQASGFARIRFG